MISGNFASWQGPNQVISSMNADFRTSVMNVGIPLESSGNASSQRVAQLTDALLSL